MEDKEQVEKTIKRGTRNGSRCEEVHVRREAAGGEAAPGGRLQGGPCVRRDRSLGELAGKVDEAVPDGGRDGAEAGVVAPAGATTAGTG